MEGNNKYNTGRPSIGGDNSNYKTVDIGRVVDVNDPQGMDRIKVTINGPTNKGGDNGLTVSELAWCQPMNPKFFQSKPKVGESVFVFTLANDSRHSDRLYMGPIISQNQYLNFDARATNSTAGFTFGTFEASVDYNRVPELRGVFPNSDDIALQGRYNTDIILKKNEVQIRAGKFVESEPTSNNPFYFKFNDKTQGYLQIKNDIVISKKTDVSEEQRGSVTNIVGSKINLLTHKDGNPRFSLLNQETLISDEEMEKILATAHPLPYGDVLIEYLRLLKSAFLNHVHNGNGRTPTDLTAGGNTQFVSEFMKKAEDLEKQMISTNIKIN